MSKFVGHRLTQLQTLILCGALSLFSSLHAREAEPLGYDYTRWSTACALLPTNRKLLGKVPDKKHLPIQNYKDFELLLDQFIALKKSGPEALPEHWIGQVPAPEHFYGLEQNYFKNGKHLFLPYARKITLAPGAQVIIQGDLHGDIHSLLKSLTHLQQAGLLQGFTLSNPNVHLCYTGDFVDRGAYGLEVIYTLLKLKLSNPTQVHFSRGNHEDFHIFSRHGFLQELHQKFGTEVNTTKLVRVFDLMPVVVYFGTESDFVQMNHGGLEPGFDPRELLASEKQNCFQLLGELKRQDYHNHHKGWIEETPQAQELIEKHFHNFTPQSCTSPKLLGFMWNDFTIFADDPDLSWGRSPMFGKNPTTHFLHSVSTPQHRLRAIVRGHQHSGSLTPIMKRLVASKGVFRHWQDNDHSNKAHLDTAQITPYLDTLPERHFPDGSVWTFNVSPDSVYGIHCHYDFATYGIITLQKNFEDWRIKVVPVP